MFVDYSTFLARYGFRVPLATRPGHSVRRWLSTSPGRHTLPSGIGRIEGESGVERLLARIVAPLPLALLICAVAFGAWLTPRARCALAPSGVAAPLHVRRALYTGLHRERTLGRQAYAHAVDTPRSETNRKQ